MAQGVSIGTAWSEAAAFVGREKRLLAPLVLALMVVPVTVAQLVQPSNPFAATDAVKPWMVIALLSLLAGLVGQMAVSRLAMGWHGSLGATIALALRRLPGVVAAFILFFLCLGLVLIPIIVLITIVGGGAGEPASAGAALANFITLLAVFAVVPRLLLAPAIAMDERLGPWTLIKRAMRASRGHYWRLLGFFMLVMVVTLILAIAASSVVGTLASLLIGAPEPLTVARLLVALVGGLVQGAVATLYAAMVGRIVAQLPERSTSGI